MSRPRLENLLFCYEILKISESQCRDQDRDQKISYYAMKFCSCRDRDSSRLGNSVVVETETHRDWEILWLSRPRLNETRNFCGCRDRDQLRLNKSCGDPDFIESLIDDWQGNNKKAGRNLGKIYETQEVCPYQIRKVGRKEERYDMYMQLHKKNKLQRSSTKLSFYIHIHYLT